MPARRSAQRMRLGKRRSNRLARTIPPLCCPPLLLSSSTYARGGSQDAGNLRTPLSFFADAAPAGRVARTIRQIRRAGSSTARVDTVMRANRRPHCFADRRRGQGLQRTTTGAGEFARVKKSIKVREIFSAVIHFSLFRLLRGPQFGRNFLVGQDRVQRTEFLCGSSRRAQPKDNGILISLVWHRSKRW